MCGLLATTSLRTFGSGDWISALESLRSRGPDGEGTFEVDGMAFGHRRLAVIGLGSDGYQPMVTDPDHVLVFNGEIYNFREIAQSLGVRSPSDTAVLYEIGRRNAWAEWVPRLRGMYAFVHYHVKSRTITVARDPFGIKPLFVRKHSDGNLSFASTAASLAASAERLAADPLALTGFLASGVLYEGSSAFQTVSKVKPGHLLTYTRSAERWHLVSTAIHLAEETALSPARAVQDSLRAHLVADVEVGVLLSGGVDSTLLAALATRETRDVRTFCLTNPENPTIDEASIARHNAGLLGTQHVEVPVTAVRLARSAADLIKSTGEPFADPAYLPLSLLSREVATHVKVALAGEGADELFGGYRRYDAERLLDRRGLRSLLHASGRIVGTNRWSMQPGSQLQRVLQASALTHAADRHAFLMLSNWVDVREHFELGNRAYNVFHDRWDECAVDPWALGKPANRAFDMRAWLPSVFLEKSDRASMLWGLELRTPYLDPAVARAAAATSDRDSSKRPLRDELHRLLPDVVLPKAKKGLSVNTTALVKDYFADVIERAVWDRGSALAEIGLRDPAEFSTVVARSPELAFRVAMVGLWQETWMG